MRFLLTSFTAAFITFILKFLKLSFIILRLFAKFSSVPNRLFILNTSLLSSAISESLSKFSFLLRVYTKLIQKQLNQE